MLAYDFQQAHKDPEGNQELVLIVNIGGSHTAVSVMLVQNGIFRVKAHETTRAVCGRKYDDVVVDLLAREFEKCVPEGRWILRNLPQENNFFLPNVIFCPRSCPS